MGPSILVGILILMTLFIIIGEYGNKRDHQNKSLTSPPSRASEAAAVRKSYNQELIIQYYVIMKESELDLYQSMILRGTEHMYLTQDRIAEFEKRLAPIREFERKLIDASKRNSQGVEFERSGDIIAAINIYEENILDGYPAHHSYKRLMILYRKQKRYQDEKRIIISAIKVLKVDNSEYLDRLIKCDRLLNNNKGPAS